MTEMYMYTKKAVMENCPPNRVFMVVGKEGVELTAWKCELTSTGINHPAFWTPGTTKYKTLRLTHAGLQKGFRKKPASNGAEPTAIFRPDSYYTKVTLTDLKTRARSLSSVKEKCPTCGHVITV